MIERVTIGQKEKYCALPETTKPCVRKWWKRILKLNVFLLQSSSEDTDSKRIKKLAKELLALERAYALLQAHVGSAVDAERDEMVITCILGAINSFMYLSFYWFFHLREYNFILFILKHLYSSRKMVSYSAHF